MLAGLLVAVVAGCVDVPDSIRAQFAGPGPQDRTNYRPGLHGAAPPRAPEVKAAATTAPEASPDASPESAEPAESAEPGDGGSP